MGEPTDAELVMRTRRGEIPAFEAIVDRYRRALVAVATARLHSPADAEDVAQEAFVRAFFHLEGLRDPAALLPWLRRMTERLALMRLRGRREKPMDPDDLARIAAAPSGAVAIGTLANDELEALPAPMRQTLTLTYLAGYTCGEAAHLLGVSEGTVKSRLSRARGRLREMRRGREEGGMAAAAREDDFTARTIARLKEEARRLLAEGKADEAEGRAQAVIREQVRAFRGGQEAESAADRLAVYRDPEFRPDEESAAMLGLTFTRQRQGEFAANAAQYGFRLEELDWRPGEATRWSGTIAKPTGEGKDTWGVPRTRLQLTIVDARELCQRLRCSPLTLRAWVQQGCPVLRCWPWARYDVARVEQWLEDNGIRAWPTENSYQLERPIRVLFREVYEGRLGAQEAVSVLRELGEFVWDSPLPQFTGGWDDGRA